MASATRPPITCHILDTYSGAPAADIPIALILLSSGSSATTNSSPTVRYTGVTNTDGRVVEWKADTSSTPFTAAQDLGDVFATTEGEMKWNMVFESRAYWEAKGVTPFFPEVEIRFLTQGYKGRDGSGNEAAREHWHVPLLMTPYNYTTYRGS